MKKRTNIKLFIGVLVIVAVIVPLFTINNRRYDPDIDKQWYIDNTGNSKAIIESNEFKSYINMLPGVDINGKKMWSLLNQKINGDYSPVVVAVIDTGIDYKHDDIAPEIWVNEDEIPDDGIDNDHNGYVDDVHGYDFVHDLADMDAYPAENSHGTMCAGIIAAPQNGTGITGVAGMAEVKLMSLKILSSEGMHSNTGEVEKLIEAIEYADANGAKICNLSLSVEHDDERLKNVMKNSDMLFVVSAGNGTPRGINIDMTPVYPASFDLDNMIVVADVNYNGCLDKYSNYGIHTVDIAAPGTCMYSTTVNQQYGYNSGTSMSTAVITGLVALMYSVSPTLSIEEAKQILLKEVDADAELKVSSKGYPDGFKVMSQLLAGY